jgi:hypothetical protein
VDLQDPVKQDHYIDLAIAEANRVGHPELAREPYWLEKIYLADQALARAAREIPAGSEPEVVLHRGGGARVGMPQHDDGDADLERAARRWQSSHYRLGS